jgi:hypothetical protein
MDRELLLTVVLFLLLLKRRLFFTLQCTDTGQRCRPSVIEIQVRSYLYEAKVANKDRQCTCDVALRRVCVTNVAVEK